MKNAISRAGHNGPRSTFSFLPFALRFRVIGMIQDGMTSAAIAADPEVAAAYARLGSTFNRSGMSRIRRSAEYRELAAKRAARKAAEYDDQLAAAMIREAGSLDNLADQTKAALLKALSDLSALSALDDEARVRALRSLTQSVTAISGQQKDHRIRELLRKLDDTERRSAAAEQEWKAREAALLARIAELEVGARAGSGGLSPETLREVEEKVKLM